MHTYRNVFEVASERLIDGPDPRVVDELNGTAAPQEVIQRTIPATASLMTQIMMQQVCPLVWSTWIRKYNIQKVHSS